MNKRRRGQTSLPSKLDADTSIKTLYVASRCARSARRIYIGEQLERDFAEVTTSIMVIYRPVRSYHRGLLRSSQRTSAVVAIRLLFRSRAVIPFSRYPQSAASADKQDRRRNGAYGRGRGRAT